MEFSGLEPGVLRAHSSLVTREGVTRGALGACWAQRGLCGLSPSAAGRSELPLRGGKGGLWGEGVTVLKRTQIEPKKWARTR